MNWSEFLDTNTVPIKQTSITIKKIPKNIKLTNSGNWVNRLYFFSSYIDFILSLKRSIALKVYIHYALYILKYVWIEFVFDYSLYCALYCIDLIDCEGWMIHCNMRFVHTVCKLSQMSPLEEKIFKHGRRLEHLYENKSPFFSRK